MPRFLDCKGRPWQVDITVTTLKRVRSALNIDLAAIFENEAKVLQQLTTDPVMLCDVLYVICQAQAEAQKISSDDFGEGLAGEALAQAVDAMTGALIGFFPKDRAAVLKKVTDKANEVQARAAALALAAIDSPETEKKLQSLLGMSSTPTPVS